MLRTPVSPYASRTAIDSPLLDSTPRRSFIGRPTDGALEAAEEPQLLPDLEDSTRKSGIQRMVAFAVVITLIAAALGWWHWQQGWAELEARLPAKETLAVQPQLHVPPDAMAQRVVYRVMPEYPKLARQAGVQGTVVLDTIVSAGVL